MGPKSKIPKKQPIRYIAVSGSTTGICPGCKYRATVGRFCIPCCEKVGMDIGDCPGCKTMGPMGYLCDNCGEAKYCWYVENGRTTCRHCGWEGPRGTYCLACLDQDRDPSKLSDTHDD
jgi:hypothetical protein